MKTGLTKDDILRRISEEDIFQAWIDVPLNLKQRIHSPLRDATHKNFFVYKKDDRLFWKDFGGDGGGDVFKFVMAMEECSFVESLRHITEKFNLVSKVKTNIPKKVSVARPSGRSETIQGYEPGSWTDECKNYWLAYGAGQQATKEYKVEPIESVTYKTNNGEIRTFSKEMLFMFRHPNKGMKFYNPYKEEHEIKFISNTNETDVYGLEQAEDEDAILVGGNKDVVTLFANTGLRGISLNSESGKISSLLYVHIRKRVNSLSVLYDRDSTGMKNSENLSKQFCIPLLTFEGEDFPGNDISDLFLHLKSLGFTKEERKEHFNEIISKQVQR